MSKKVTMYQSKHGKYFETEQEAIEHSKLHKCKKCEGLGYTYEHRIRYLDSTTTIGKHYKETCSWCEGKGYCKFEYKNHISSGFFEI